MLRIPFCFMHLHYEQTSPLMPFAKQMSNNNLNANVLRSKTVIVKILQVLLYAFGQVKTSFRFVLIQFVRSASFFFTPAIFNFYIVFPLTACKKWYIIRKNIGNIPTGGFT